MASMEVDHSSVFDIEAYIGNYTGHTKVARLRFIAEHSPGTSIELDALTMAAQELRQTLQTTAYRQVAAQIQQINPTFQPDSAWAEETDRKAEATLAVLESELHGHKANLVKESIRLGQQRLGDFYYSRGRLQDAFKCYVKVKDYCFTPKHIMSQCLSAIKVSIEQNSYPYVSNYVTKAEQIPDAQLDAVNFAMVRASAGLAALSAHKYEEAARHFTQVLPLIESHFDDVIAPHDIAVYGGMCALATMDRLSLREAVINNVHFREFLELVPEMRELVWDFYHSRYSTCLHNLARLRQDLRLDLHMRDGVDKLCAEVRDRALVQSTTPYASVGLQLVATWFNTDVSGVEEELAKLITSKKIQARIDSHGKVLFARTADARVGAFQRALAAGDDYMRNTKAALLRASLQKHDLVVQREGGGTGGGGGGGGGGGRRRSGRSRDGRASGHTGQSPVVTMTEG